MVGLSSCAAVLGRLVAALAVLCAATGAVAQGTGLTVIPLRPNVHLITGAGGNIVVQHGEDGVVVVGSGDGRMTDQVLAEIRKLSSEPIRFVINTSAHPDNIGGNAAIAAAGEPFERPGRPEASEDNPAVILAHEAVNLAMVENPPESWPTETHFTRIKTLFINGEGVEIRHRPAAYSDGDITVFFRRSDVIVAGELIDAARFPQLALERGGSVQGLLRALNELIWEAIPQTPLAWRPGGTLVVPLHGRVYERDDIVQYRDMVTIVRDRVQKLIERRRTRAQVLAANPAAGYVGWYGQDPRWNSDRFVDAVYTSLTERKP